MKRVLIFLLCSAFSTTVVMAQHARGYSEPGLLGMHLQGPDKQAPEIIITKPASEATRADGDLRGLSIVPEATGEIALLGYIEDNRQIAGLTINGHEIQLWGKAATKKKFGLKLKAPAAGKVIRLNFIATDRAGNSTDEVFVVSTTGFEAVADMRAAVNPKEKLSPTQAKYWALVVAVGEYSHPSVADLDFPQNDAKDIAMTLYQNYTFEKERIILLTNPTRAELIGALSDFAPSGKLPLNADDNLLVFYAGHGHYDENYDEGYWLPSDAEKDNRANWVSNSDVQRAFRGIQAQHILLLSDACFSGSMFATRSPFTIAIEEAYKERSRKAITAGNLAQVPDRSIFKEYLVKRLQENTNTYLDAGTLYGNIKAPVTNNSPMRQRPLYGVIQQTGDEGGEFIFMRRE